MEQEQESPMSQAPSVPAPTQVQGDSQAIMAEADPAYVNIKVKQQVALCRLLFAAEASVFALIQFLGWRNYPFQN